MTKKINVHEYTKGVIWDILIDCLSPESDANTTFIDVLGRKKIDPEAHENCLKQAEQIMCKIENTNLTEFVNTLLKEVNSMIIEEKNYQLHSF